MRMHPLHDKDLDRLSRNAAEHYEMDFGPSGWEQLEKRLDQELPQQKKRRRFLFWLFFIAITSGGALTGLLINSQPVVPLSSNRIQAGPAQLDRHQNEVNNSEKITNKRPTVKNDKAVATIPSTNTPNATTAQPETPGSAIIDNKPTPGSVTGVKKARTPGSNRATQEPAAVDDNNPVTTVTGKKPATPQPTIVETKPDIPGSPASNKQPETTASTTKENKPPTAGNKPTPDSTVAEKQPAIPHLYKQPLELGVVAGPDVSTVSFGPLYKTGYNFGITLGYRFNNRWSINTGAIYTRKYYQADSNTFHAPKHSYIDYVDLDVLKGYCAMWDIPVNVRYDFSFNDKRRFFASAGASTYLMKHQNYDYWYWQRGTGNYKDSAWGSNNGKQYVFSVLNLSLGYEKMISKHFSIQAEPYIKIPLKGLGYGDMKIGSYGMFFSLKYRPVFKAKQAGKK